MRWWNSRWAISNPQRWCCESAALNIPANLENSAVATGLEKVSFHSNPKEKQINKCSNDHTIALISHASKVMLKILQTRLQQYMNQEFPDVQDGFRKGRGNRDQNAIIQWFIEKAREFQKRIYICLIDYTEAFDCGDLNKLWKTIKEMRISEDLIWLLQNLFPSQESIVRTRHGSMDWFKIGKGACEDCIYCPPAYVNSIHHVKCQAGWSPSWNQDCWEKYQ